MGMHVFHMKYKQYLQHGKQSLSFNDPTFRLFLYFEYFELISSVIYSLLVSVLGQNLYMNIISIISIEKIVVLQTDINKVTFRFLTVEHKVCRSFLQNPYQLFM